MRQCGKELLSYLDVEKRPYIHLLDGGLSDNMALRGILEGAAVVGGLQQIIKNAGIKTIHKLVFLAVNAETSPEVKEYRSDHIPSESRWILALSSDCVESVNFDSISA